MSSRTEGSTVITTMADADALLAEVRVPGLVRLWPLDRLLDVVAVPRGPTLTVGRDPGCELFLDEDSVSRRHAELRALGDALELTDLGSSNRTTVSGQALSPTGLASPGQVVTFGRCTFLVVANALSYAGWTASGLEGPIVGGPAMRAVRDRVVRLAAMPHPVLVTGQTGCGKEVIARALHAGSGRAGPLVAVNCAAVPERLFEDQFFGHAKGAFTGADRAEPGLFRAARGGTLFLDEVGELEASCQPKLLRALEASEVIPLGATRPEAIDVRVVAATNRDLAAAVDAGEFRADLYSRIRVLTIAVPPLAERREDVVLLARHFLAGLPVPTLTDAAVRALVAYGWPGNARELRNALVDGAAEAAAEGAGAICVRHLRPELRGTGGPKEADRSTAAPAGDRTSQVVGALRRHDGNVAHAAKELGLHRAQVYKALREAGIEAKEFRKE